MLLRLALFFVCLLSFSLQAADNLRLQHLSVEQGLSQNSITSLLMDQDGFLWIATEGGLNRFDGYEFRHIEGPGGIFLDGYISTIAQTADGGIWVALPSKGVFELAPRSSEFVRRLDARRVNEWFTEEIVAIREYQGDVLIVSESHLHLYDRNTQTSREIFELEQDDADFLDIIRAVHFLDDSIVVATSNGVRALLPDTFEAIELPHVENPSFADDRMNAKGFAEYNNKLFIATVEGLYSLPLDAVRSYLKNQVEVPPATVHNNTMNIWDLALENGAMYLATHRGLYIFQDDGAEPELLVRLSDSNLPIFDDSIRKLLLDSEGNFWLGTAVNGLFYWQPSSHNFTNLVRGSEPVPDLSNNVVWAVAEDLRQRLWMGTQNGLDVLLPTGEHQSFLRSTDEYSIVTSGTVYDIFPDPNDADTIWLYVADTIRRFDYATETLSELEAANEATEEILSDYGWGYRLLNDDRIWFYTSGGLASYHIYTHEARLYQDDDANGFDPFDAYYILGTRPDYPNEILLGLASELWTFNKETLAFTRVYRHEPYQLYSYITPESQVADNANRLWVTMSGAGLAVLNNDTLELEFRLHGKEDLPTNAVYAGQRGVNGELWFSSHAGILRINPETRHVEQFTYNDGTSGNEFNYRADTRRQDGSIAYGGMRGITIFDPANFRADVEPPRVRITDVDIIASPDSLSTHFADLAGETVTVAHDVAGLRVRVSSLQYSRQNRVRYSYELQGPSNMSLPAASARYLAFPRLNPGTYTLHVYAHDPRDGSRSDPALLHIEVLYHPWLAPRALILYGLLAALIVGWLIWYRFRQHQRVLRSKEIAEASEERLKLALSSSGSGVWDWHQENDVLYENRLLEELGHTLETQQRTLSDHIAFIYPRDRESFEQQWTRLVNGTTEKFDCTYRMRHKDGHWLWFRDLGKVTQRDKDGVAKRVTGAFQNITEARANRDKALLFGKAFEQTMDWVLLLDNDQLPLTANHSFCAALGVENVEHMTDFRFTGLSEDRLRRYKDIIKQLKPGEQWRGEDVVTLANGREVPVLMNISAVLDSDGEGKFYVLVLTNISAQKEAEEQLRQLANYDPLTGLANRNLLLDRVMHSIQRDQRQQEKLAVMFIDLDRFKQINDSLGHSIGDQLLCTIANRLQSCLREEDTVARLGGDEFIVMLEGSNRLVDIELTAARILETINEPVVIQHHQIRISPSLGVALYPEHGRNAEELLKHADIAMYHAKDAGRNCYRMFELDMDTRLRERLALETELKQAVTQNTLINYYQPIMDAQNGEAVGVELLLRWWHNSEFISPERFIPIAEDLGIIIAMTDRALRQGLTDLVKMRQAQPDLYLSVNLSVRHLDYADLPQQIAGLLKEFNLPPSALRFEITEGILIEETMRAGNVMRQLRELGIHLLLDDFGTGYSSLRYVKEFPVGFIKIDRSFTKDIGHDPSDEAIIESILAMAHSLNKRCIAEGVETAEQKDWLLARRCSLMQGYFFGRPMPLNELLGWLVSK